MRVLSLLTLIFITAFCLLSWNSKIDTAQKDDTAFNKELIINIKGDTIAGYAFIAKGKTLKETIILVAGYPGNDNNFDIAQKLRRNGKNVISFNHRGAWGSQGTYSYSNCLEDIEKLIKYLSKEKVATALRIDTNKFVLLGRSYGGGIALIKGSKLNTVSKIIAISTANYGEIMRKYTSLDELSSFKKYMKKQIMMNHDIDSFLQELLDNKIEYSITHHKDKLAKKPVLLIEDSHKNDKWINQLENVTIKHIKSDHNFIDKRNELANAILEWLKN